MTSANAAFVATNDDRASLHDTRSDAASRLEPQPLLPDSLMWQDFGSYLFHLMLPQAFVMQTAHPVISAAVSKDKKYKVDPWGRAANSTKLLWPVVYSRPDKAIAMGRQLRELHRAIKGVSESGEKYHALDPEAYSWVHITGFDATVRAYEFFVRKPLTPEMRTQMFEEWKQMGAMLGIIDKYIPQTEEAYWQHFNYIIEERLEFTPALHDLLDPRYFASWPKPPNAKYLPNVVWKLFAIPFGWFQHKLSIATLPENFRNKLGLKYSKTDQAFFRFFAWSVRTFYPLIPERLRYIPLAWRAITDARKHPEAYRLPESA